MGVTVPRHRMETDTSVLIDCTNQCEEELNLQIVTLALDHGHVIAGPDVMAIMWDSEAGIRWTAQAALVYLDDLLDDHETLIVENLCLVVRQSVPEQIAN